MTEYIFLCYNEKMYSYNPETGVLEVEPGLRYDLHNEYISIDDAQSYAELYDMYAPLVKDVVHLNKLQELFEDLPHIDEYGYLVYDDFYTPYAVGHIDDLARAESLKTHDIPVRLDALAVLHNLYERLSGIASRNTTRPRLSAHFLAERKKDIGPHYDAGDGTTFLSNFFTSDGLSSYKIWPYRFDDRPQELTFRADSFTLEGTYRKARDETKPHPHPITDMPASISIKSGQLVVLAGSALRQPDGRRTTLVHSVETDPKQESLRFSRVLNMAYTPRR